MKKLLTILCLVLLVSCSEEGEKITPLTPEEEKELDMKIQRISLELGNDLSRGVFLLNPSTKKLLPLSEFVTENNLSDPNVMISIFGRCSSLQMVKLSLFGPDHETYFDDMGFFIDRISEIIDVVSPSEKGNEKGIKSILVYEYFLDRYKEVEDSDWLSEDRVFCSETKRSFDE